MEMNYGWLSDTHVFNINRAPAHSSHCTDGWKLSLNGIWKMHYSKNLTTIPKGFEKPDYDVSGFNDVQVPLSVEMQGFGHTAYNNFMYPWDGHEDVKSGDIPKEFNPTSSYVKDIVLDGKCLKDRLFISFQGVESGMALWVNGAFVGYSEDSFTPHEFELTKFAKEGLNRIAVQVYRFTSSSWLEDQDFFRFSGIFREVFLYTVPTAHIFDVFAKGLLEKDNRNGVLDLEYTLQSSLEEKPRVEISVTDEDEVIMEKVIEEAEEGKNSIVVPMGEIEPWSAEYPKLYKLSIVVSAEGNTIEKTSVNIGFRRFEIEDGIMKINGKRIVFNGVNRHEMSCETGRTVSYEDTEQDIINMKRHNINAIRTCHYPDQTFLYDLCDKYGLYVIDECNLETHGTWSVTGRPDELTLPGSTEKWKDVVLDRANSMVERDKNHPSIVMWSCGNESCGGKNIFLMSELMRNRDNTRVIHYEGISHDRTYNETSDVESQMYTKPWDIKRFIEEHPEKPFICCEYMHAMGNSCGNMNEYTDLTHEIDRYQGGFIWDYIDQAFTVKNRYGEEYLGYGGDFDDRPNDYNFCGDGIVFADRTNTPKIQEVKYCYQNARIEVTEDKAKLTNYYLFTDLSEFNCMVTVLRNGELYAKNYVSISCAPGESTEFEIFDKDYFRKPTERGEYAVIVSLHLSADNDWAEAMYEVAFGQTVFNVETENAGLDMLEAAVLPQLKAPRIVDCDYNYTFKGDNFEYIFSKRDGGFLSMRVNGKEFMVHAPKPDFWRAPTNNDIGCNMPAKYAQWQVASKYSGICGFKAEGNKVSLTYKLTGFNDAFVTTTYTVNSYGAVKVELDYDGINGVSNMPEFGMMFVLPADYGNVSYYGKGPDENMLDRHEGAKFGKYEFKASENMTPYLMPQECGNRTHVRFAKVTDSKGHGLMLAAKDMELSVLPYTPFEIENAEHHFELPDIHYTVIRANLLQMGVGGDDTWGAPTHEQYQIKADQKLHFEFWVAGI